MSEIKCYAITIPNVEIFDFWMSKGSLLPDILKKFNLIGVNNNSPEFPNASVFFFRTPLQRNEAYNAIHDIFSESMCAVNVQVAYIDEKYL